MTTCDSCKGFIEVEENYEGPAVSRCVCNPPAQAEGEFSTCEKCGGHRGPVPENYDGAGTHKCYCSRSDHQAEEAFRASGDGSGTTLGLAVGESIKMHDKLG